MMPRIKHDACLEIQFLIKYYKKHTGNRNKIIKKDIQTQNITENKYEKRK